MAPRTITVYIINTKWMYIDVHIYYECNGMECKEEVEVDFTSFCQPTRLIACTNYGSDVQIFTKFRQSMT